MTDYYSIAINRNERNYFIYFVTFIAIFISSSERVQAYVSFDCQKAKSIVERMICDSESLAEQDGSLASFYRIVYDAAEDKNSIQQEQRHWIKNIRDKCTDKTCIEKAYSDRISYLGKNFKKYIAVKSQPNLAGKFVLRATLPEPGFRDGINYQLFCTDFSRNLNEFRHLKLDTCHPRLSEKYSRFSRPKWNEIPLDLNVAKDILTGRPSMGIDLWLKKTETLRNGGDVKLWIINLDLFNDKNIETLIKLDHAEYSGAPYCQYFDSKQMVMEIPNSKSEKFYKKHRLNNSDRLGGDMVYDEKTNNYYLIDWHRNGDSKGWWGTEIHGPHIGADGFLLISRAIENAVSPVCAIEWVPTKK